MRASHLTPKIFTLKMITVMFTEILEGLQYPRGLSLETEIIL
jgi:hypothetical protein